MVNFTKEQLRTMMSSPDNIRNISIIAHVDHGKSTLTDSLLQKAGIVSKRKAGEERATDTRDDEKERGITIKSTGISLYFEYDAKLAEKAMVKNTDDDKIVIDASGPHPSGDDDAIVDENSYLINLIDSPGHVDFSSEVTAALRVTDGAVVVVDAIEGVCTQTETVLRQALAERVKPVLFLNKLDRVFLELKKDPEEAYLIFRKVIENVNSILSIYQSKELGELEVSPLEGTVAFGSGYHQWAFTLQDFAKMYAPVFKKTPKEMLKFLWGDFFFDSEKNKWTNKNPSGKLERGFVKLIMKPIYQMVHAVMDKKIAKDGKPIWEKMCQKMNIKVAKKELEEVKKDKDLLKKIMQNWLPANNCLLETVITHLPSPRVAQKYRTALLYKGPVDDEVSEAMRNCDPNGPLMVYISKMIPQSNSGRFYAFGRIFSGTVCTGQKVTVIGPNYEHPSESGEDHVKELWKSCPIQQVVTMMASKADNMKDIPCGNTCALVGMDTHLIKTGTLTTAENPFSIVDMKYSVSPVVRRAVSVKNASDLPKLVTGIKKLAKSDPLVQITYDKDTGECVIAGAGELHLEICLKDLEDFMKAKLVIKEPIVSYRETVIGTTPAPTLAKASDGLNRIWASAFPMPEELQMEIEDGDVCPRPKDVKAQARHLVSKYGYDANLVDEKKLWAFGPDEKGPNLYMNGSAGVDYLNECRGNIMIGFAGVSAQGPLCREPLRGVNIKLTDAKLHSDATHRRGGDIIPPATRSAYGAILHAQPRLMEPIYLCNISVPLDSAGNIYGIVSNRRGEVVDNTTKEGNMSEIKVHLPVAESFGFDAELRAVTGGKAFAQCAFDHWAVINDDPFEEGTLSNKIVTEIRVRKGMKAQVPTPECNNYVDKL